MPIVYKKVMQEVPVPVETLCNRCGKKTEEFATLTYTDREGTSLSVYCLGCYDEIILGDNYEPTEKSFIGE